MGPDIVIKKKNHAFLEIKTEKSIMYEIKEHFTFQVPNYQFMSSYVNGRWDGKIRLYKFSKSLLPIGLLLKLLKFCKHHDYKVKIETDPVYGNLIEDSFYDESFLKSLDLNGLTPYDYQERTVELALKKRNLLILSPTSSGKSLMIYMMVRHFLEHSNSRALLVVPSIQLVHQMKKDMDEYSQNEGGFSEKIHLIYQGQDKNPPENSRLVISTWQSIYKEKDFYFRQFEMVLIDEVHHVNYKAKSLTTVIENCTEAKYRIGLTGSLDGTNFSEIQLNGFFGPTYKSTTVKDMVKNKQVANFKIETILLKYPENERRVVSKMNYQKEVDYLINHEKRSKFIRNISMSLQGNTLVLFKFVDKHGKKMYKDFLNNNNDEDRKIFYVSGETEVSDREDIRRIVEMESNAIIVASLGTFSTGINIKNLNNIVFATPTKSRIKVLQSIGRGLRLANNKLDTKIYDIVDDLTFKNRQNYSFKHGAERLKIYGDESYPYRVYNVPI